MKKLCSVNFLPSNEDRVWLNEIVSSLSKTYDAPLFMSHLTIYGNLKIDPKELRKIVRMIMGNIQPFSVAIERISFSENLGKTLFIQIQENEILQKAYGQFKKELASNSSYQFNPHMSLMYKSGISSIEKEKLIKTISIPKKLQLSEWSIVTVDTVWSDVISWKTIYQEKLG